MPELLYIISNELAIMPKTNGISMHIPVCFWKNRVSVEVGYKKKIKYMTSF